MFSSLLSLACSAALFGSVAQASSIPSNLQAFYNQVKVLLPYPTDSQSSNIFIS
jgi:hypothetical protein